MRAASIDIKDYLITLPHLSLVFGQNLFIGKEPDTPDFCTTIFDGSGAGFDIQYDKTDIYDRATVAISVKGTSYEAVQALAWDIYEELHNTHNLTINDITYTLIVGSTAPFHVGWDKKGRVCFFDSVYDIQRR